MERDFGLEIPPLDDDDTQEIYFAKFADVLKLKKGWSIALKPGVGATPFIVFTPEARAD